MPKIQFIPHEQKADKKKINGDSSHRKPKPSASVKQKEADKK